MQKIWKCFEFKYSLTTEQTDRQTHTHTHMQQWIARIGLECDENQPGILVKLIQFELMWPKLDFQSLPKDQSTSHTHTHTLTHTHLHTHTKQTEAYGWRLECIKCNQLIRNGNEATRVQCAELTRIDYDWSSLVSWIGIGRLTLVYSVSFGASSFRPRTCSQMFVNFKYFDWLQHWDTNLWNLLGWIILDWSLIRSDPVWTGGFGRDFQWNLINL